MSCAYYKQNELYVEDCRVADIAREFGTPCYIYSKQKILHHWDLFHAAFDGVSHRICYSVKANSNIAILHLLAGLGASFDIVSLGELERVIVAGGNIHSIVFSGVGKSTAELKRAIELGIYCIDVESIAELFRIHQLTQLLNKTVSIALRINPDVDALTHAHITTGQKHNKFGIELSALPSILSALKNMPAVKLIGIACHIGSQITSLKPYELAIDRMISIYQDCQQAGFSLSHINVGGGLGITYHHESPPSIPDFIQLLIAKLAHLPIEITIEPGRSLVGESGILLTTVEYLKSNHDKEFAIVDAGMTDFLRPALYDAWQAILPVMQREAPLKRYDIAGPVCESADILGKARALALQAGDLLIIDNAGAYGFSMTSNYNSRPRPAEVLIDGNKVHLIRQRETINQLYALEKIPT